jgi:hypothetical protein
MSVLRGATEIRRLRPEDHAGAAAALVSAYADHVLVEPAYADRLVDLGHRDREAEVWVATADGAVVGTVTICPAGSSYREIARDDELEFRMLAVSPTRRAPASAGRSPSTCWPRRAAAGSWGWRCRPRPR